MKRDELHRRLRDAGQGPAPEPDAAFADALEQRLRTVHATLRSARDGASATIPPRAATPRAWWRSPVPVAAALALILMAGFGAALREPAGVELAAAFDATVTLPDGRSVPAEAGQRLTDGMVVLTGPSGHVVADGVRLGPGEVAVVRDARLEPVREAHPAEPEPGAPTAGAKPGPSREPVAALPSLPAVGGGSPRPEPARPPSPSPSPQPSQPAPPPEPATRPAEPSPEPKRLHATASPDGRHQLGLAAGARDGRVYLMWTEFDHPDFAFFVILRSRQPAEPSWPLDEGTELIGRSHDPERRQYLDERPPYPPVYRLVAVDRQGRELARSGAVAPDTGRG